MTPRSARACSPSEHWRSSSPARSPSAGRPSTARSPTRPESRRDCAPGSARRPATCSPIALLDGSLIGASVITLSSSYAIGDYLGLRHSLHRRWSAAPTFHRTYAVSVALAGGVVLVPGVPLGLVTTSVQALAGVLLPSATVFLLLLCNDRSILGPWVNPPWVNGVAVTVVGVLIGLSALLTITTAFPKVSLVPTSIVIGAIVAITLVAMRRSRRRSPARSRRAGQGRPRTWTTPSIDRLPPPTPSRSRSVGLVVLRVYLVLAVVVLAVRVAQIAIGR